jgi:asparagine synthase (glutamine-hydrolysing)
MCGIAGIWNTSSQAEQSAVDAMVDALARRGPDGKGTRTLDGGRLILGHRRLSIIDLSDAGSQPMCNEDGSIWLTFNGEIYNYLGLRAELQQRGHVFRSHSDSETIIHAYEEWGTECVRRLRGIFAFAIYDGVNRGLFLARDQIGVKPLYYLSSSGGFLFASQPGAILASGSVRPEIDRSAFSLYLAYGNVPGQACIYDGIQKLLPGHWLFLRDGQLEIRQYWKLRYESLVGDFTEAAELIRSKIEESVVTQAVSDVPIGTLLSGGVDSTIITSILAERDAASLSTFTIGFDDDDSDESRFARPIAERFGTRHHEKTLGYEEACALLEDIVEAIDEPFHLNGLFPYFAVAKLAQSSRIKVVLGGDGADELFAGYRWYESFAEAIASGRDTSLHERLLLAVGLKRRNENWPIEVFFRYNGSFDDRSQRDLLGIPFPSGESERLYAPLARSWQPGSPPVLAAQFLDFHCFLVDHCLTKVDRMSMACGVEVRVPFLDLELIETAFKIDHSIIFRRLERKALLKSAMKSRFPPDMDIDRKKGFSSPIDTWLASGMASAGDDLLRDGSLVASDLIDANLLRKSYSKMNVGQQLALISAELWARRWIDRDPASIRAFSEGLLRSGKCENGTRREI